MVAEKYANVQPLADFDWDLYEHGYTGTNLVPNLNVKTKNGDKVYCHEPYAQELYDMMEAHFNGQKFTPKDSIPGATYNVSDIKQISDHEIVIDTDGGMSAIVDMNKEHQFMNQIGCSNVKNFMQALHNPEDKKIILQQARNAKVTENRVSIWDGFRSNIEKDFMDQLKAGTPRYGYTAHVLSVNNGGYMVDINGITCFMPGSLASSGPIADYNALVGTDVDVCVVNYSKQTNTFVVSNKMYRQLTLPSRVKNELYPGMRVFCKVTGQSKNGLFCLLRDNKGEYVFQSLMHRTTMSPDAEQSFDAGEFIKGDMFVAYIHRINWDDDGMFRIVIGDQDPHIPAPGDDVDKKENQE